MANAARKIGVTAVPLNYRLSAEEAAYVTDHCDATLVYVDAEFAPLFERIRNEVPKVEQVLVFDGSVPVGMLDAGAAGCRRAIDGAGGAREHRAWCHDDLHVRHDRQAEGRLPARGGRSFAGRRDDRASSATRPTTCTSRPGPLYHSGPGGFMGIAQALGQTVVVQRKFDAVGLARGWWTSTGVTSTFSAPTPIRMICSLPADVKARVRPLVDEADGGQRRPVELRPEADVPRRLPG